MRVNPKENTYNLKDSLFKFVQKDCPGYSGTEKQSLELILSRQVQSLGEGKEPFKTAFFWEMNVCLPCDERTVTSTSLPVSWHVGSSLQKIKFISECHEHQFPASSDFPWRRSTNLWGIVWNFFFFGHYLQCVKIYHTFCWLKICDVNLVFSCSVSSFDSCFR